MKYKLKDKYYEVLLERSKLDQAAMMYIIMSVGSWFPTDGVGPGDEQEILMKALQSDEHFKRNLLEKVEQLNNEYEI